MKKIEYLHSLNSGEYAKLIKKYICDKVECKKCPLWESCKDKFYQTWEDELEEEICD